MMPRNGMYGILLTLIVSCGNGEISKSSTEISASCDRAAIGDGTVVFKSCNETNGISYATYENKNSNSPYVTEFDKNKLIIVTSHNKQDLLKISGFKPTSITPVFTGTKLDVIPSPELISTREILSPTTLTGWSINQENIQYFDPHGAGYIISCFTAFKEQNDTSIVVSECLPYGQLEQFRALIGNLHVK